MLAGLAILAGEGPLPYPKKRSPPTLPSWPGDLPLPPLCPTELALSKS